MGKNMVEVRGKFFEVPSDLDEDKIELFKDWCEKRIEWEEMDKTFDLGDGVIVHLPRMSLKHKRLLSQAPGKVRQEFDRKRKKVQDHLAKMMLASRKVNQRTQAEVKEVIEDCATEMLELFGRDMSVAEVHRRFKDKGVNIPYPSILNFAKRNDEKIRELRNKWRQDIDDVSITIKRSRLEKLNYLLNDLLQYYDDATPYSKISFSKEIRGILEQARKEVEGEEIKLTINGRIDIEATIASYLNESNMLRDLTVQQIVISRVASRLGLPAMVFVERLAHSFYSKFNGFRPNNDLTTKILYPSSVNYDILDLESKNRMIEEKEYEKVDLEIEKESKVKVEKCKDKLDLKLRELLDRHEGVKKSIK